MIREIEGFTRADYIEAIRSSLSQQGWDPATAEDEADEAHQPRSGTGRRARWPNGGSIAWRSAMVTTPPG